MVSRLTVKGSSEHAKSDWQPHQGEDSDGHLVTIPPSEFDSSGNLEKHIIFKKHLQIDYKQITFYMTTKYDYTIK